MTSPSQSAYARAGVDIDAAADAVSRMKRHISSTRTPGVLSSSVGGFGGMFSIASSSAGLADPVLVSSIDGVGTKLNVAFATGRHDTIGRDLVNHCTNDILVQGAKPLFFLDYFATGILRPDVAEAVVKGLADGCRSVGCALIGGETAEMPGLYDDGEYDLAGTIVGIVDRTKIIDGSTVKPGDIVLGLASDGLHTNGYSLARRALLDDARYRLGDHIPSLGVTLADALLSQHRCYANAILPILAGGSQIKSMAHITGGGFVDNIPRCLPDGLGVTIDRSTWVVPQLFRLIQSAGTVSEEEMFRVFNMGIGFIVIAGPEDSEAVAKSLTEGGETVVSLGRVTDQPGVVFTSLEVGANEHPNKLV
jgi:phosphoribosylformylglycinamidine cyclo-ligase